MLAEEREICLYLKSSPGQFISAREIARRAGGKSRYNKDPHWAVPFLAQLLEKKVIEKDSSHNYRLVAKPEKKKSHWISPQMKKILEANGNFTHIIEDEDLDLPKE
jgi:hypothetical protein